MARKTRSAEITSFGGAFRYAPGLTVAMTVFLASLVGIPPLGGWYAKFSVTKVLIESNSKWGLALAIVVAVNTAVAAYYYLNIAKTMWFDDAPDGDESPVRIAPAIRTALVITIVATIVFGTLPGLISDAAQHGPVIALGR